MFCKKCGRQLDDNSTYCPSCGSPTENANNAPNTTYYSNNYDRPFDGMGLAGVILGAVGCLLAWIIALFGYIFGGIGLALACSGKRKNPDSKLALAGIIVSAIALVFALTNSILGVILVMGSI